MTNTYDDRKDFSPIRLENGDTLQVTYMAHHSLTVTGVTFHCQSEEGYVPLNQPLEDDDRHLRES